MSGDDGRWRTKRWRLGDDPPPSYTPKHRGRIRSELSVRDSRPNGAGERRVAIVAIPAEKRSLRLSKLEESIGVRHSSLHTSSSRSGSVLVFPLLLFVHLGGGGTEGRQ